MSAITRFQQGVSALLAFTRTVEIDLAAQYLTPQQLALFQQMSRNEQLHSLNVLRDVLAQSPHTPDDLAIAALLHDVGKKDYPLAIWQKVVVVLCEAFLPGLAGKWSATPEPMTFWRRPFIVRSHHPAWSANLLREIHASERAIWLVQYHAARRSKFKDHPDYALLDRLKLADDAN